MEALLRPADHDEESDRQPRLRSFMDQLVEPNILTTEKRFQRINSVLRSLTMRVTHGSFPSDSLDGSTVDRSARKL